MRILARPAFANHATDPGNAALYGEIQRLGCTIIEGTNSSLLKRKADIVHLHWPDNVLRSPIVGAATFRVFTLFCVLSLQRLRGAKIVWTAHNAASHEHHHPQLERIFWRGLMRRLDAIIAHSETVKQQLQARSNSRIPIIVVPLSCFHGLYPEPQIGRTKDPKLCRLGFVGRIRRYKGVDELVDAFASSSQENIRLLIRGKPEDRQTAATVEELCSRDPRIDLKLGFLSPNQLSTDVAGLDAVILPFKWVTNSGSALLSLSLGTKVIVPDTEYFRELQSEFGSSWVYCFKAPFTSDTLADIAPWAQAAKESTKPIFSQKRSIAWAARTTLDFYQTVISTYPCFQLPVQCFHLRPHS